MQQDGNEKDASRQSNSEKKSLRERQRRSEMNEAFAHLANTVYEVQPTLNSTAPNQTDNIGSNDNPNHGSTHNELEDKIANRVDLILYTVEVVKQLQKQKDAFKNELSKRREMVGMLAGRREERQGGCSGSLPAQASSLPMSSNRSESLNLLSSNARSLESQHLQRVAYTPDDSAGNTNSIQPFSPLVQGLTSHDVALPSPLQNQHSLIDNALSEGGLPQNSPEIDSAQVDGECDNNALTYKQQKQKKDQ